jgi:hypothetical protein
MAGDKEFSLKSFGIGLRDFAAGAATNKIVRGATSMAVQAAPLACGVIAAATGGFTLPIAALLYIAHNIIQKTTPDELKFWDAPSYMAGWRQVDDKEAAALQERIDAARKGYLPHTLSDRIASTLHTRDA